MSVLRGHRLTRRSDVGNRVDAADALLEEDLRDRRAARHIAYMDALARLLPAARPTVRYVCLTVGGLLGSATVVGVIEKLA